MSKRKPMKLSEQMNDPEFLKVHVEQQTEVIADQRTRIAELETQLATLEQIVCDQTEDEALWAYPTGRPATIAEAHALQELRKLHAAIDNFRTQDILRERELIDDVVDTVSEYIDSDGVDAQFFYNELKEALAALEAHRSKKP